MNNTVLAIIGMHRSGTSLTSGWLNECGLHIGTSIAKEGIGNIKGHFEDNDFLNFHHEILDYNQLSYLVQLDDTLEVSEQHLVKARSIIDYKNKLNKQWGWKEPRTCLFLNTIYKNELPGAKYLVLIRHFDEVVQSLYARDLKIIKSRIAFPRGYKQLYLFKRKKNLHLNRYLNTWVRYNQEILSFLQQTESDDYLVTSTENLVKNHQKIFDHLTNKWEFNLTYKDINDYYDDQLNTKQKNTHNFDAALKQMADKVYSELSKYL